MLDRISHRGPDGRGIKGMHGHVRLSLVDLSDASAQPFELCGSILSFNGEIWNHNELRKELQQAGVVFRTTGDTEVLAAMLDRYGISCLNRLDGMFAFSWTSRHGESWVVRDSFGKVPMYVAKTKHGFMWASERKAFTWMVVPLAIPPGHAFCVDSGKWLKWYSLPSPEPTSSIDVLKMLDDGVKKRLSADAPVCCLISGGLDSSLVLALAKRQNKNVVAYTAYYNDQSDDLKSAIRICDELGVDLVKVKVKVDTHELLDAILSIEIASKAQIEIAVLCLPLAERIRADGFKACLSGEAADELFGGYGNFCIKASGVDDAGVVELRKELLAKMSRGNFIRCNKVFMAKSIECRLPFMEQRLVERTIQLGKKESPVNKKLLKAAAVGILPNWVINRKKDTFQGGSGVADKVAAIIRNPKLFYNSESRKLFGYIPKD